jgi:hypothetical protein
MSLIDVPQVELLEPGQGPTPRLRPDADSAPGRQPGPAVYALVYHDPDALGAGLPGGWTLTARYNTGWCWSVSLAARGAGTRAAALVAQAVAMRILTEQGVAIEGWAGPEHESDDQESGLVSFGARPVVPAPAAASPSRQTNPWLRRLVSRQLQGH